MVVTDGEASEGYEPDIIVRNILSESPVVLHTIGFCIGSQHSLNQGDNVYYFAADDATSLSQGLQAVLAEEPAFDVSQF